MSLFLVLLAAGPLAASPPRVILILADYLTIDDLTKDAPPAIARLVNEGGIALLTPSVVSARNPEASYASASAGANCWGSASVDGAYNRRETVKDESADAGVVFARRTGIRAFAPIVHLELFQLRKENAARGAISLPGALGDELARAGLKCAVFGNSDTGEDIRRRAAVIGSTSAGLVDVGDVGGNMLRREPFSPTGYVTDAPRLAGEVDNSLATVSFVVVDFGDTDRVELNRDRLSEKAYEVHRRKAIANLDGFISRIMKGRAAGAMVMLVSMVAPAARKGERDELGTIVIRNSLPVPGSLISSSTRTEGLVSAVDFAPTVLDTLGLPVPRNMIGGPMVVENGDQRQVGRLSKLVVMDRRVIVPVLAILGGLGIAAATLACVALALGKALEYGRWVRVLIAFVASSPVSVLFATLGEPEVFPFVVRLVLWMIGLTLGAFIAARVIAKSFKSAVGRLPGALPIIVLMVFTSVVLLIDAILGGQFSRFTVISAGRFDGYRFYGIGNEYMGIWLGMALVSIVWIRECFPGWSSRRSGKAAMLMISAALIAALGFPRFGANAGGAVAAVVGLGLVYRAGVAKKFGAREVLGLLAAAFALVALIGLADLSFSKDSPSHIGRAASLGGSGWHVYVGNIALRKVTMNLALIGTQQAKLALLASVPFFVLWFWMIGRKFDSLTEGRPAFRWGVAAAVAASVVAFLFNDSGIVAFGLILGFTVSAVGYSLIDFEAVRCTE